MKKPKVIGHRGAAGIEPENTLLSIQKAIDIGVDFVEIDVHLSNDGELVVIHDDTVDRTTDGKGKVKDLDLGELRLLDAGKGERIPTLQEVISLVKGKVELQIELKGKRTVEKVVKLIENNDMIDSVMVISFWHDMLKKVKKLNKNIKTGVLFVGGGEDAYKIALNVGADALSMAYMFVDKEMVDKAHKKGFFVGVWNIDDADEIEEYVDMGVDAIASNRPDILVEFLKK